MTPKGVVAATRKIVATSSSNKTPLSSKDRLLMPSPSKGTALSRQIPKSTPVLQQKMGVANYSKPANFQNEDIAERCNFEIKHKCVEESDSSEKKSTGLQKEDSNSSNDQISVQAKV
jgi:hypothetical protein